MGLFSRKKKITVSSVTYNLAGDEKDRVKYLPTTVITKIVANNQFSMSDAIQSALLNGPGIRMRSFARWARSSGYSNTIGMSAGKLIGQGNPNNSVIAAQIPHSPTQIVSIQSSEIGGADYAYWAEQWMVANHPEQLNTPYEIDYLQDENTIFILFPSGTSYSFQPVNFDYLAQYLFATYVLLDTPTPSPPVMGTVVPLGTNPNFPATPGWILDSDVTTPTVVNLNKTVRKQITYSDGRPAEDTSVVTPSTQNFNKRDAAYSNTVYMGNTVTSTQDVTKSVKTIQHNLLNPIVNSASVVDTTTETITGGVVKTTKTTTTTQTVGNNYSYRRDTQEIINKSWSRQQVLIYKFGDGNSALDSMFGQSSTGGDYFPFIPVRKDARMLDTDYFPTIYKQNVKAYKKAFGLRSKYSKLVASLEDNESISDVDYGYIVFGVSLNTKEAASLKYVYKFFQLVMQQGGDPTEYDQWKSDWNQADISVKAWVQWKQAQSDNTNPLFGTLEPVKKPYPESPMTYARISSSTMNYDMAVGWNYITESVHVGVGREGAKTGDLWWSLDNADIFSETIYSFGQVDTNQSSSGLASLIWQDSPNTYRAISTRGLVHNYTIYKGKGVNTTITEALSDPEVSGFVLPLNEAVFRSMSLVDSTQMSQANAYIVLNSYKVVKQKWYATSWFKVILVIIVIVITVVSAGSGASSAGLLGTAATVGAALGFSGIAAIVVGTIANALAAMLLMQIISAGATALFGEKVGAIVGAVASVVAVSVGTSLSSGQGFAASFSNLSSAENIMRLSVAAGNGLAQYIGAESKDILKESQELMQNYANSSKEIADAYEKNLGFGQITFDPLALTDAIKYDFIPENSSVFLGRTLLTGTDIAGMTNDLLTNFTQTTLNQELS